MNILLAGRLGRCAERILAFERLGHKLVYCTMPAPEQKPLPDDLKDESVPRYVLRPGCAGQAVSRLVDEHAIDVVYSMKNSWDGSLELVEELLDHGLPAPIVRHHKEHFCVPARAERRSLTETAAQIYINQESLDYFRRAYGVRPGTAHVLDTDYLPAACVTDELRPKLYDADGAPHLLVAGGLSVCGNRNDVQELCTAMAMRGVRVHLYGRKYVGRDQSGVWGVDHEPARRAYEQLAAAGHVRLHDHVEPAQFTREWSCYDAGLMHPASLDPREACWERMNQPNRLAAYVAAGLPLAQHAGGQDAMERVVHEQGIGFLYSSYDELAEVLHDRPRLARLRQGVLARRHEYTFEHHAPRLVEILARCADGRPPR